MSKNQKTVTPPIELYKKEDEVRIENAERKYDNTHIKELCKCEEEGVIDCYHFPKHFIEAGYPFEPRSFKDVPGWINDAEHVYEEMVNEAVDGDYFIEIGTLLGQSATRMTELIRNSGKKIKFDSIDLFWLIPNVITDYKETLHPHQFYAYYEMIRKTGPSAAGANVLDIVRNPLNQLGLIEYVNFITCDEKYAFELYKDSQLKFVWIDGDHSTGAVYDNLVNFWPKIKSGGVLAGDDLGQVKPDVEKFVKEYKMLQDAGLKIPHIKDVEYGYNHFKIRKQ